MPSSYPARRRTAHPGRHPLPRPRPHPPAKQQLALDALAGQPITELARQHHVSRTFVYRQAATATQALTDAFDPTPDDPEVLFYLPVTRAWLRQFVLALVLICHSPLRGVVELLRDLFDYPLSLGTVHNIVHAAVPGARARNDAMDLAGVRVGRRYRE